MAILLANYDLDRDYLSNFEPFVVDQLRTWPPAEEVRPKPLSERLSATYHLPPIPINTVTELRERVAKDGYLVTSHNQKYLPDANKLAAVAPLAADQTEFLGHFQHVAGALRAYAKDAHGLDWDDADAEAAIEQFVEEFSVELAVAKQSGDVDSTSALDRSEILTVAHGFARQALTREPTNFKYLEEVVQASMLTNVLYFQNLGSWVPTFRRLVVFFDTTVTLRLLGLTDSEVSAAARQMLELVQDFEVPVQIFDHTLVEIQGVLEGVQHNLRTIRTRGMPNLEQLARQGQEVLAHALQQQWGPADLQEALVNLESKLAADQIQVAAAPTHDSKLTLSESRLEEILKALGYQRKNQRTKDIRSLSAVYQLRGGAPARELGDARAIFVTSNDRLVRASDWWFTEEGKRSTVPHCIGDISFTTQLWLRKTDDRPDVPRKFLIAESFAALNPPPELWHRYVMRIAQRRESGDITDEQVKALVFSAEAKEGLLEVTHGDPDRLDDGSVAELLARYEARLKAPLAEQVDAAHGDLDVLRTENTGLRASLEERDKQLAEQGESIASQDRQIAEQQGQINKLKKAEEKRAAREREDTERRRVIKRVAGTALAFLVTIATVFSWAEDWVGGPIARAGVGFVGVFIAVAIVAWSYERSPRWAVSIIVLAGSVTALFFGLVSIADHESEKSPPSQSDK
jgi:hypothetical protein